MAIRKRTDIRCCHFKRIKMSNAQQLIDVEKISQADLLKFESDYPHKCEATGCVLPAESGVCIEFYPLPAYMAFHRSNAPITYMLVGLRVCHKHLYEFDAKDFFTNEDGSGEKMIRLVEN